MDAVPGCLVPGGRAAVAGGGMTMGAREPLRVRVNDELVLDAGTSEEQAGPAGPKRIIVGTSHSP